MHSGTWWRRNWSRRAVSQASCFTTFADTLQEHAVDPESTGPQARLHVNLGVSRKPHVSRFDLNPMLTFSRLFDVTKIMQNVHDNNSLREKSRTVNAPRKLTAEQNEEI